MGFVLGGALALGLLLVDVIRLRPAPREPAPAGQASPAPSESGEPTPQAGRRPLFFSSITLGTLGFALMHIFLNLLFGYRELVRQPQIAPLALLAGLGLSLAVWDWPRRSRRPAPATLLARLLAVAAVFALVHLGFIWIETQFDNPCASEPGLAFAWPSSVYRSLVPDGLSQWGLGGLAARLVDPVLCHEGVRVIWHRVVAVVDFAAVGVALAVGLMFGLSWAVRSHFERVERDRKAGP
jgi:hypothetical protein